MATKFLEPGGDADFLIGTTNGFWRNTGGTTPTIVTDFVHGTHQKSIKYPTVGSTSGTVVSPNATLSDTGSRISMYIYIESLPSGGNQRLFALEQINDGAVNVSVQVTTSGALQLWRVITTNQIGTNGPILSTGQWYRICLAYTITSTSVNRFELFVDGVSAISVTNATLTNIASSNLIIGTNSSLAGAMSFRTSDHYVDDSSALTDTGNIWVTAKRPNANGTANNFVTQIGSGGSGYGSGHSPQVNERALSTTNGWSVAAVAATTEEYNIESKATGDIDISTATIVDYVGWVSASSVISETASIVVNNATSNISLTSTNKLFTAVAGSATYPAGTGTDIGVVSSATATTVSLYECGILVAYIPVVASSFRSKNTMVFQSVNQSNFY